MNKLKTLAVFTIGLACGGAATYYITKQKYENILDDEIQSVKDTYKNRQDLVVKKNVEIVEETTIEEDGEIENITKKERDEYTNIIKESGYVNYTQYMNSDEKKEIEIKEDDEEKCETPYVIEPDMYGEDGYDTQSLTYYADKVLVDDLDDIVDDPDTVVGLENLKVFEEFGATSVIVRNEIFKIDYEILKDDWNYADLNDDTPSQEKLKEYYKKVEEAKKKPHEL